MRRIGKIILTVFMMLVLIGVWVICDNWNTIIALVDSVRYTQEELEVQMEETKKELQNFLDENEAIVVRDLTVEEQDALNEGKISGDQAVLILTGQSTLEEEILKAESGEAPMQAVTSDGGGTTVAPGTENATGTQSKDTQISSKPNDKTNPASKETKPNGSISGKNNTSGKKGTSGTTASGKGGTTSAGTASGNSKPASGGNSSASGNPSSGTTASGGSASAPSSGSNAAATDQKISEYIAQLYVYKNEFLNRLAGMENTISDEFYSQPQSEWNRENKERIVSKYMGQVGQWEKECDTKVYGILTQIETTLTDAGRDTGVVSKIEENYSNEKRLKKAYYMDRYTK